MNDTTLAPASPADAARVLTAAQVADLLAVSTRTFWRLIQRGQFPQADLRYSRKLVRWRASTVLAWLDRQPAAAGV